MSMTANTIPGQKSKIVTKRIDNNEVIYDQIANLNDYINQLLKIPEVILSDNFSSFLDEESHDGDIVLDNNLDVSNLDVLLADEENLSQTIFSNLKLDINVVPNSVIVWSFKVARYDIGFSIKFGGVRSLSKEVVGYQR